jgi:hypothetical protein
MRLIKGVFFIALTYFFILGVIFAHHSNAKPRKVSPTNQQPTTKARQSANDQQRECLELIFLFF